MAKVTKKDDKVEKLDVFDESKEIVDIPIMDFDEIIKEEEVVKISEPDTDPTVECVFDSAQVELWLTRAPYRPIRTLDSILIKEGALPEEHFLWLFGMVVRSVKPGGVLYAPKSFPSELLGTFKEVKDKSTGGYLALLMPERLE